GAVLIDQLVYVDRGRGHTHTGALHRDLDPLEATGVPEHVPHGRVAERVLEVGLCDPLGPQRVARQQYPGSDLTRLGADMHAHVARSCHELPLLVCGYLAAVAVFTLVTLPAVVCPSGRRSTPRKRVRVYALRGFESHRHRSIARPAASYGGSSRRWS